MTLVKIVKKSTQCVANRMYFTKDDTIETLLYWVKVALAGDTRVYAEFKYRDSLYLVKQTGLSMAKKSSSIAADAWL